MLFSQIYFSQAFRKDFRLGVAIACCLIGTLQACSFGESNRRETARSLLNQKRYTEVVAVLANPKTNEDWLLLANAHLGAGGFELFPTLKAILGQQQPSDSTARWFDTTSCSQAEINLDDSVKPRAKCVFLRLESTVSSRLGDDHERAEHLLAAHTIYSEHFANLDQQSSELNFERSLAALLATLVHFKTLHDVELRNRLAAYPDVGLSEQLATDQLVLSNLKGFVSSAFETLNSLRGSYLKLADLLHAQDGKTLVSVRGVQLTMTENFSKADVFTFLNNVYGVFNVQLQYDVSKEFIAFGNALNESPATGASTKTQKLAELSKSAGIFVAQLVSGALQLVFGEANGHLYAPMELVPPQNARLYSLRSAIVDMWDTESSLPVRVWRRDNQAWLDRGLELARRLAELNKDRKSAEVANSLKTASDLFAADAEVKRQAEHLEHESNFKFALESFDWLLSRFEQVAEQEILRDGQTAAFNWLGHWKEFHQNFVQWLQDT